MMAFRSFLFLSYVCSTIGLGEKPNFVLILTNDQGHGEIAAYGTPIIKTPRLDALHSHSVRFTNFHIDPTCSPTAPHRSPAAT